MANGQQPMASPTYLLAPLPRAPMNFDVTQQRGVTVIASRGNVLGGPDGADLHDYLSGLREQGQRNVVMSLASARLVNSSGLGMLVAALTTLRNAGGDLRLAEVPERVLSLFVITKLDRVFKTFPTVDEAVASYEER